MIPFLVFSLCVKVWNVCRVGVIVTVNLIIDEMSGTLTSGKNRIERVLLLKR
jgi:hypothetical protein